MANFKDLQKITFDYKKSHLCEAICPTCGSKLFFETTPRMSEWDLPKFLVGYNFVYEQALKECKGNTNEAKKLTEERIAYLNQDYERNIDIRLQHNGYVCPKCKEKLQFPSELIMMLIYDGMTRPWKADQGDYQIVLNAKHVKMVLDARSNGLEYAVKEVAIEEDNK